MAVVICVDAESDWQTALLAAHRRRRLYPTLRTLVDLRDHRQQRATRPYFEQSLLRDDVGYVTGSGHGKAACFLGFDQQALLETNTYDEQEVDQRIFHLLCCSAALELGPDMVRNGCKAFFGYNAPFVFDERYLDEFMAPAIALDLALAQGATAGEAHARVMKAYTQSIKRLRNKRVDETIIGFLIINRDCFCSPSRDSRWGDAGARL